MNLFGPRPQRHFERIVRTHQDRVFSFAVYLLGDRTEAADVTQEVLIRLWRHREALDEDRLLAWLLRVTRNACIDALRRRTARRNVEAPAADGFDRAAARAPMPDAEAEAADFQRHLEQALHRLPEPHRSIVFLREVQELRYDEISGTLDLPLNTVKVYLHRGRKMLRTHLADVLHREPA